MNKLIAKTYQSIAKAYSLTQNYKLALDLQQINGFDLGNPCNFAT